MQTAKDQGIHESKALSPPSLCPSNRDISATRGDLAVANARNPSENVPDTIGILDSLLFKMRPVAFLNPGGRLRISPSKTFSRLPRRDPVRLHLLRGKADTKQCPQTLVNHAKETSLHMPRPAIVLLPRSVTATSER